MSNLSKVFAFFFVSILQAKSHMVDDHIGYSIVTAKSSKNAIWRFEGWMNKIMHIYVEINGKTSLHLEWAKGSTPIISNADKIGFDLLHYAADKADVMFKNVKPVPHLDGFIFKSPYRWGEDTICCLSGSWYKFEALVSDTDYEERFDSLAEAIEAMDNESSFI